MAHPQQKQLQEVINWIRDTRELATKELSAIPNVLNRVTGGLTQLDNYLSHLAGIPLSGTDNTPKKKFGPITIEKKQLETQEPDVEHMPYVPLTAQQAFAEELKKELDQIQPTFLDRETDDLLESLTDPQVRGIAKRVGIPVTENKPEKITTKFIEDIKNKMRKDAELANTIKDGQSQIEGGNKN